MIDLATCTATLLFDETPMTYAIIEIAGSQLRVEPGRYYEINYLGGEAGDAYSNDRVLLVNHNEDVSVGQPLVSGAVVEGEILSHKRGKKVIVYKMQPKRKPVKNVVTVKN